MREILVSTCAQSFTCPAPEHGDARHVAPRQSSVEALRRQSAAATVRPQQSRVAGPPPPSSNGQPRGVVDAARWHPQQVSPPQPSRRLDVEALLASLRLELRLPTGRRSESARYSKPGSVSWMRGLVLGTHGDAIDTEDKVASRHCIEIREQGKQGTVQAAKQRLLPTHAHPSSSPLAFSTPAEPADAVDVWALRPGQRWTCRAIFCALVGSLFSTISRPPFAATKQLLTLPLILFVLWLQARRSSLVAWNTC